MQFLVDKMKFVAVPFLCFLSLYSVFFMSVLYQGLVWIFVALGVVFGAALFGMLFELENVSFAQLPMTFNLVFSSVLIYVIVQRVSPFKRRYGFGDTILQTSGFLFLAFCGTLVSSLLNIGVYTRPTRLDLIFEFAESFFFMMLFSGVIQLLSRIMPRWAAIGVILLYFGILEFSFSTPLGSVITSIVLVGPLIFYYFMPNPIALGIGIFLSKLVL